MAEFAAPRQHFVRAGVLIAGAGLALLGINVAGWLFGNLRHPAVDRYRDFAGTVTLPYEEALRRLAAIPDGDPQRVAEQATRVIHEGMAHLDPDTREMLGLGAIRLRVPVWENYLLFALAYLKPDTYADYEFCDYRRAVARGVGRCGQQSLALVDFLAKRGIPTGFVNLGGHTIVTARTGAAGWVLLDPDYGGVIPFDLARAEADPASVIPYYWNDQIRTRGAWRLFDREGNEVKLGGPSARWSRACMIEQLAYVAKWLLPVLLLGSGALLMRNGRGPPR